MVNNSLEDKNVKMLLVVVVVGLVIYLLVSYLNGNGICGSPSKEGFNTQENFNEEEENEAEENEAEENEAEENENPMASSPNNLDNDSLSYTELPSTENTDEINSKLNADSNSSSNAGLEHFQNSEPRPSDNTSSNQQEVIQSNNTSPDNLPSECYPKDVLSSGDLLPNDANSTWAQVNPNGQGSLGDKNFLNAGYHVGVNTVGQSLRNANRQLRSDPPNPQVKVSPWMQTTIEPDVNRKPMEIGA